MTAFEVNFDGIVGPTHHYGGLSFGNVASDRHRHQVSRPRVAALQGLEKMKLLSDLGLKQGVFPPHQRPHFGFLREHGFIGPEQEIIAQAARARPDLLSIAYSAASMWAANMATVSPSADTSDGRVHFTPANLVSTPHRALEAEFSARLLRTIFADEERFVVHDPLDSGRKEEGNGGQGEKALTPFPWVRLPSAPQPPAPLSDEGAANHTRLCTMHPKPGIELFVYGRNDDDPRAPRPRRFPARQSREASEAIVRNHRLDPARVVLAQQHPEVIDAGVFHNDVIAVGNEHVFLCHEFAFWRQREVLDQLTARFDGELHVIQVSAAELSVEEAVGSYLFNSQLLTLPGGEMLLLCPSECEENPRVRGVIDRVLAESNPVNDVRFIDVRQSMQNGGGPACLRLRVVLNEDELAHMLPSVLLTDDLYRRLRDWITRHYREELALADLRDPGLVEEVRSALEELTVLLGLEGSSSFQQSPSQALPRGDRSS